MRLKHILITVVTLTACLSVCAQEDINALTRQIALHNKALEAQTSQDMSQVASMRADNTLPDPEVEFSHLWGQNGIGNKMNFGISQGFDWPGLYKARGHAADMEERALDFLWKSKYLETMLEIKSTIIDIIYAKRKIALRTDVYHNMDSLYFAYKRGMERGEVSVIDLNKLAIERIAASRSVADAGNEYSAACARLQALNGGEPCESIIAGLHDFPMESIRSLDDYVNEAMQYNPLLQYADSKTLSIEAQNRVLSQSRLPGFSLGYSFDNEMGEKFHGFSVGMSLPVYSRKYQKKALLMASNENSATAEDITSGIIGDITSTRQRALNYIAEIEKYGTIFSSGDNIRLLNKAFAGGQISLMEYITDIKYFLDAQGDYEEMLYLYNLDTTKLNRYSLLPVK